MYVIKEIELEIARENRLAMEAANKAQQQSRQSMDDLIKALNDDD